MNNASNQTHEIEVFFDGGCPLCAREVGMFKRWDRARRIRFIDIAADDFRAADYGVSHADFLSQIHARLPDGTWVRGVEVFRRLYTIFGYGWLVALSRLPVISQIAALAYRTFARNRLRLTGRCAGANKCAVR